MNRSGVERYSIPLFFGSNYDVKLEVRFLLRVTASAISSRPLFLPGVFRFRAFAKEESDQAIPSCCSEEFPPKYPVVTAGDYVKSRLEETYAHSKK